MEDGRALFDQITGKLVGESRQVTAGRMMSSPGIRYRNKTIAFYHQEQMVFKLGKGYDPGVHGVENYSLLSPFKTKPPLAGWFQVPYSESDKWETLARQALAVTSEEMATSAS